MVGGTHYYTQSLLFENALADLPAKLDQGRDDPQLSILNEPTDVILQKLKAVDPVMAERWHPNERRKIQRSLEIFLKTGKPASQVYEEQRMKRESGQSQGEDEMKSTYLGLSLRFPTLLLWVHAQKDVLYNRCDSRILKMIDKGLLAEVDTLTNYRTSSEATTGKTIDQTRGIWVSIGYKEFLEYQSALSEGSTSDAELARLKKVATEKMQAATRQFANRQIRWIRIKLLNALAGAGRKDNAFLFDGTDLNHWEDRVIKPATEITENFLAGQELPSPMDLSEAAREMLTPKRDYDLAQRPDLWQKKTCETCGMIAVTENEWTLHIKSRGHRRAIGAKKKLQNSALKKKDTPSKMPDAELVDVLETYLDSFENQSESPK
jgi:tRNA dimethylallyltransferase